MREWIIEQLSTVDPRYKFKAENNRAWICCPFHKKNGQIERTPSLVVNLDTDSRFKAGSWRCFACGQSGSWNSLADVLNLEKVDEDLSIDVGSLSLKDKDELFGVSDDKPHLNSVPWDKNTDWRGIKGQLIYDIGGLLTVDQYLQDTQLFLPVYMNKKYKGGINCRIIREKWQKGYFNTEGEWAGTSFFPYDYSCKLMSKLNKRVLFLCEGPRDALTVLQNGIPALAILGTQNWTKRKKDILLSLDLDLLVLALDNDEPGIKATNKIFKDLKGQVEMRRLKLPDGQDPANLSEKQYNIYKKKLNLHFKKEK